MKVYVIAECGVSWGGNMAIAKMMIKLAKDAGADAAKFQAFLKVHVEKHPLASKLRESSIDKYNGKVLKEFADSLGIEFLCTPFYPEAVDFLAELGVKKFKIRELDSRRMIEEPNYYDPIVRRILDIDWRNEIYISCQSIPLANKAMWNSQIRWLYCVPKYPPRLDDIDFSTIGAFHGYSNHYPDIAVPLVAATLLKPALPPKIIEVHVTPFAVDDTPDAPVNLRFDELGRLVKGLRILEQLERSGGTP